eukprot:scaffold247498_cov31-Tisochrysis_lutea.AAC.3
MQQSLVFTTTIMKPYNILTEHGPTTFTVIHASRSKLSTPTPPLPRLFSLRYQAAHPMHYYGDGGEGLRYGPEARAPHPGDMFPPSFYAYRAGGGLRPEVASRRI